MVVGGCAGTTPKEAISGPAYAEPDPGGAGRATLRSVQGIYVMRVDEQHVKSSDVRARAVGGNRVVVSAGKRHLRVIHDSSVFSKPRAWDFDFTCEKGHTYEFKLNNTGDSRLKVTDVTVGESLVVSNDELVSAW
jgi:hypothetical protein